MHVMFIHPNFPTSFANVANYLATQLGWKCTYVTSIDTTGLQLPFDHLNYRVYEGPQPKVFQNPDNLQGLLDHALAAYKGLRSVPQVQPELVIGHVSYGTMLYLRTCYKCPFVGYYEMLPPPYWSDELAYRREFPPPDYVRLFNATYHALTYLHLHAVDAVYTPTRFQMSTAPTEMQHKFKVLPEGIDCSFFQRRAIERPVEFRGIRIGPETRVVTYVSPGLESVRGFDIFMKAAKIIAQEVPDALFLIAGAERTIYGHEPFHIGQQSFKQWVLSQDQYPLERFHFLGVIPVDQLATLFSLSDVHVYLTVPHLISQSMLQAMASACVVVGSRTTPVLEFIEDGQQGLLADFYDHEGLAARAIAALRDPAQYRPIGEAARDQMLAHYEVRNCLSNLGLWLQSFQAQAHDDLFAALGQQQLPPAGP